MLLLHNLLQFLILCFLLLTSPSNSNQQKDLYKILGVSKTATPREIKRAYREKSLEHHPDRNPGNEEEATQKFQEIGEAYEILSDEDKRKVYDNYGYDGLKNNFQNTNFHFHDPFKMFQEFFGDDDIFANFGNFGNRGGRGGNNKKRKRGHSLFDDMFNFDDMGFGDMGDMGNMGGINTQSFSFSGGMGGGMGGFQSMSEQTMFVNGKKIRKVTKQQNGKTIEETYENDKLIEKIIDGSKQALPKIDL